MKDQRNYHQNRYAEALGRYVTPRCFWLDLGAGTRIHGGWLGPSQETLAERPAFLLGVDPDTAHLIANTYLHGYARSLGEWFAKDRGAERFDLVTANMVLEHLDDPVATLREVRQALKPGGRFVAMTPYRWHPVIALSRLVPPSVRRWFAVHHEHRNAEHVYPTHYKANSRLALWRLAARAGFEIERVDTFQSSRTFFGGLVGKLESWAGFHSNILVVFRKPCAMTCPDCGGELVSKPRVLRCPACGFVELQSDATGHTDSRVPLPVQRQAR